MPKEFDQFLEGLEDDQNQTIDILEQPLVPEEDAPADQPKDAPKEGEEEVKKEDAPEDGEEPGEEVDDLPGFKKLKPKNRRERRLMAKLEAERNASITTAQKLAAKTDAGQAIEESDYLKAVEKIYGTDSPEATAATDILKKALVGVAKHAEESAYSRFEQTQQEAAEAERQASEELDSYIDAIESTYGIELSEKQEQDYFRLLEKMSPKDASGNIVSYADADSVWEVFVERSKKTTGTGNNQRAKQLSNRSMTQGTAPDKSNLKDDSTARFLKDSGII